MPPIFGLLFLYIWLDPFKVINHYDSYYVSGVPCYVPINRDYVSTQTFIDNYSRYKWDSFIFGNSRSIFFEVVEWKKYIGSRECFHFDASSESLLGIYQKINFLQVKRIPIKNALILIDHLTLIQVQEKTGHLFMSHPVLSGQNKFWFHIEHFKIFLQASFWWSYFDFLMTGEFKNYMTDVMSNSPIEYDKRTNELKYGDFDRLIKKKPSLYYTESRLLQFYKRNETEKSSTAIISERQRRILLRIKSLLHSSGTKYRIIISPLYDQLKVNKDDLNILIDIFGKKNVYDFSGKNSITDDYHNYYESSHYRPVVTRFILQQIYR